MDKNLVFLEGTIGEDYNKGKSDEGKPFVTFSLCIDGYYKEIADSTERNHYKTYIRVFLYDKKQLDYLDRVGAHAGVRASVFGRLSSYRREYKGIGYIQNNVVCRDITIIKTKSDK